MGLVSVVVVTFLAAWIVTQLATNVDWVAIATLASAMAAAVGAIAAWRAAVTSSRTGRNALQALAISMRPAVDVYVAPVGPGGSWQLGYAALTLIASIQNEGGFIAADVEVEVFLRDGGYVERRFPRVEPCDFHSFQYTVPVAEIEDQAEDVAQHIERIVVTYSDARGLARYQRTHRFVAEPGYLSPATTREFRILDEP